jgi:hypothetical protein
MYIIYSRLRNKCQISCSFQLFNEETHCLYSYNFFLHVAAKPKISAIKLVLLDKVGLLIKTFTMHIDKVNRI